jgi:hypothetical protein
MLNYGPLFNRFRFTWRGRKNTFLDPTRTRIFTPSKLGVMVHRWPWGEFISPCAT